MSKHSSFRLIGDPHVTRKFEVGVPLARLGERENNLFTDFASRLWDGDERLVIVVGDLFEKPICSLADLHKLMGIILAAARGQPERIFILLAGNHDISPQEGTYGAFHILEMFNGLIPNLMICLKPKVVEGVAVFPWEWNRTAFQQLKDVENEEFDVAVGHWDLISYDLDHIDHLCPAKELTELGATEIYSGHWHVAGDYMVNGVKVVCTGSMQPMTHAEDPDEKLYVTLTLQEYDEADPLDFKDKYVRVIANQGEEVTQLMDCLGFKVQRKVNADGDWTGAEVKMEEFKVENIINKHMKEHDVPTEVSSFIKERIDAAD